MAITPLPHPTPGGVVGAACTGLAAVAGSLWSARPAAELVAGVEELQRLKAVAAALEAELVAELDVRQVARRELGWGSTADWFSHLAGTTRGRGRKTVAHARLLTTDRVATLQALRDGEISPDQVDVVVSAVERLPLAEHLRRRGERVLLEEAGRLDATDLHRAGRHLVSVVDPEGEERAAERALEREERAAHLGRFLSIGEDGCGGIRVSGRGSVEDGAVLRAALLPLTRPAPTIDPATCEEAPDPRDHGARMWDGLVGVARHALDTDLPPTGHGARPRVAVTLDAATLAGENAGVGVTEDGLELSGAAVRRLGCDCDLVRVLLDSDGAVLDVGRSRRLVTPAIWTALVARDHHCAFPGCTRPPVMCHAHHLHHWADGGTTALDNLIQELGTRRSRPLRELTTGEACSSLRPAVSLLRIGPQASLMPSSVRTDLGEHGKLQLVCTPAQNGVGLVRPRSREVRIYAAGSPRLPAPHLDPGPAVAPVHCGFDRVVEHCRVAWHVSWHGDHSVPLVLIPGRVQQRRAVRRPRDGKGIPLMPVRRRWLDDGLGPIGDAHKDDLVRFAAAKADRVRRALAPLIGDAVAGRGPHGTDALYRQSDVGDEHALVSAVPVDKHELPRVGLGFAAGGRQDRAVRGPGDVCGLDRAEVAELAG